MGPKSRLARRLAGGALVVLAPVAAVLAAKSRAWAPAETGPAYRQKGPEGAPVTIVEFSDFQCPACRKAEEPLAKILELYGGKTRLIFKHFPLERPHPWALPAATAAECAGRQDRFWDLHGKLYERQSAWSGNPDAPRLFRSYAKEAGVDLAAFDACMEDASVVAGVRRDIEEGDRRWVNSTPTFFVNGRRFVGGQQLATVGSLHIEKALKR